MNAIELRGVTVHYGGLTVVHDLDLAVMPGEVVALLGANGAGKSSTVRAVCGLAAVNAGSIHVLGADVTKATLRGRARRGLGTITDDRGVFSQLTVAENLLVGRPRGAAPLPLDDWFPGLGRLINRRAGLLSGGEQTTLALARALGRHPEALVVDELTAGLAPAFIEESVRALRRAAAEWGTGVLLADQNARAALDIADRAVVLRRGREVLKGVSRDVANEPGVLEATYLGDLA